MSHLAPSVSCPECGATGAWRFHCDHEGCSWLTCECGAVTFATQQRTFLVCRPKAR